MEEDSFGSNIELSQFPKLAKLQERRRTRHVLRATSLFAEEGTSFVQSLDETQGTGERERDSVRRSTSAEDSAREAMTAFAEPTSSAEGPSGSPPDVSRGQSAEGDAAAERALSRASTTGGGDDPSESGTARRTFSRASTVDYTDDIRSKIRQRFDKIKRDKKLSETTKRRQSKLRAITDTQKSVLERKFEEARLEQALVKAADIRMKMEKQRREWQHNLPTPQQQYDFFTKIYERPEDAEKRRRRRRRTEDETSEETPLLDEETWGLTEFEYAVTPGYKRQVEAETQLYRFSPYLTPPGATVHGFGLGLAERGEAYAGPRPSVAKRNMVAIRDRLQAEGSEKWFENDRVIVIPPMLTEKPYRRENYVFLQDQDKDLVFFKKAMLGVHTLSFDGLYLLNIDISKILFTHHPLFSKENMLAMQLMQDYSSYLERKQTDPSEQFDLKLTELREKLAEVDQPPPQQGEGSSDGLDLEKTLYVLQDILETRQLRNIERKTDHTLYVALIQNWQRLKDLRETQGYSATSIQLFLQPEEQDGEAQKLWEDDLRCELEEVRRLHEISHLRQVEEYKRTMQEYKVRKEREKVQREIEARERRLAAEAAGEEQLVDVGEQGGQMDVIGGADENEEDDLGLSMNAPRPPPPFDEAEQWRKICEGATNNRRQPGSPHYTILLGSSGVITPIDQCPTAEQARRRDITKHKIRFKIYFNDIEVCESSVRPLNADFYVSVGLIYSLHVFEWPQGIQIKLSQNSGSGWSELSRIILPSPDSSQIVERMATVTKHEEYVFSSDVDAMYEHTAVGAGFPVKFEEGRPSVLPCTSGIVQGSVLWGRDEAGMPLIPPGRSPAEEAALRLQSMTPSSMKNIREQLLKGELDLKQPENAQLLTLINEMETLGGEISAKQLRCFRLEPPDCELISEAEFASDKRFLALELRSKQVPEFRNIKMMPANAREISPELFKAYYQRLKKEKEKAELKDIDGYRQAVNKYLAQVREQVIQRLAASQLTKSYSDVVVEPPLPSLANLSLLVVPDYGRPLKPPRQERLKITAQNLTGVQVKIMVNVVRAFNVPVRVRRQQSIDEPNDEYMKSPAVEPFVEVVFQDGATRTSTMTGSHPMWNQQLFLDFKAPNDDFTPAVLQTVQDLLYFNLYDAVSTDMPSDDRFEETERTVITEKRWLGTFKMPFSTLYFNGKIYGTFRLDTPPILLGYTMDPNAELPKSSNMSKPYIQLFIAIEPPLLPPEPLRGKFESVESEELQAYAVKWRSELQLLFSSRRYVPMVMDMNGRSVMTSRYLRAIAPPASIASACQEDPVRGLDNACRIVSLVPFVADPVLFPGMCDIWGTCQQFVQMLCGDEEEHALLFACWTMGLGLDTYLVLGNAMPEGPRAAYVLVKPSADAEHRLYNPCTGHSYLLTDQLCPLHVIGTVCTAQNVWANIQRNEHPSMISFDVNRPIDWKPFFTKSHPLPDSFVSVQPESLVYIEPDQDSVAALQDRIERSVRDRMTEWRPHRITRFNRQASNTLRQLLPVLETDLHADTHEKQHRDALGSITEAYKMSGFPLNMGFDSTENVLRAVHATNIHRYHQEDIEFALAVYVHPYTNGIMSVWVYIASLVRRR